MKGLRRVAACLLATCLAAASAGEQLGSRIVFLGDSITDGFTYPLLVGQALSAAGQPVSHLINAGVAGDTAADMLGRLDRDVLPHRPTLVVLSVGINDVLRGVTPGEYETRVAAIADRFQAAKIPLLILTTTLLGPRHRAHEKTLAQYNAILRGQAEARGCRVAEVHALMAAARDAGGSLLEADQVHLNFAGYRVMARAVLDALDHRDVPVPEAMAFSPLPGVISPWLVRPVGEKEPDLDGEAVPALRPDATWHTVVLPEKEPLDHWWQDQERQRGFAMGFDRRVGKAKRYVAVATLTGGKAHRAAFLPGATLQTIWLNGQCIYRSGAWRGWHPGRERVEAGLAAGENRVVIEAGSQFFLSVHRIPEANDTE